MNRVMLAAIAVVLVVFGAAIVMCYDVVDDSNKGDGTTTPTDSNDQVFEWPAVNDPEMGSIGEPFAEGSWNKVWFRAEANIGYIFVRWVAEDGSTYSTDMAVPLDINNMPRITAEFEPVTGSKVIEYQWMKPVFGSDGSVSDVWSEETFTMVIDSMDWSESIHSVTYSERHADEDRLVPSDFMANDVAVQAIADYLEPMISGLTDIQKAQVIMYFVTDAIEYGEDLTQYGYTDFWAFPMETVYSGVGDCEDTAVLYASIASVLGLQSGIVSFTEPVGHIGAAVCIGDPDVSGNGLFSFDGATYAFVETTRDRDSDITQVIDIGYLGGGYSIADGYWTPATYVEDEGTIIAPSAPVAISGTGDVAPQYGMIYGSSVFGDSFSEPPTIDLSVGDNFTYTPTTSLPSRIVAYGTGIVGSTSGGFLTWDPDSNTLYGKTTAVGTYQVTLTATWSANGLTQTAYQVITFNIEESGTVDNGGYAELVYSSGEWNVIYTDPVESEDNNIPVLWIVAGALAVVVVGVIVARSVL